jgi:hypothetical protein
METMRTIARDPQQISRLPPRQQALLLVQIQNWRWHKAAFGSIMEATFTITNGSAFDVKDVEITCEHAAPSGTKIDQNTRTIYEIVRAGECRTFTNFNMGFIANQVDSSAAKITDLAVLRQ